MVEWKLYPEHPQRRAVQAIVEGLRKGAIMIYPTDTLYGLGCDMLRPDAISRICTLKKIDPLKVQLSIVCSNLSELSRFAKSISTPVYRLLKHHLPGPYTFILLASKEVPKILKTKKQTIGLRVPDHAITKAIIDELGHPLLSVSLPGEDPARLADPDAIREDFGKQVDYFVNGGPGGIIPSTIIDFTSGEPIVQRQGLGPWA